MNTIRPYKITSGARCAIHCNNTTPNFFGIGNCKKLYLGTICTVSIAKKNCTIQLDNKDMETVYWDDVILLRKGDTSTMDEHILYRQRNDGIEEEVANTNPSFEQLKVGDLVLGMFQYGNLPEKTDAWYHGRIAELVKNDDGSSMCSIAYDDKNYETNTPLGMSVVTLLESGFDNQTWLEGLQAPIPSRRHKKECREGVIVATRPKQRVPILYTKENGDTFVEQYHYIDVVNRLLVEAKKNHDVNFHIFPTFKVSDILLDVEEDTVPTKKQKVVAKPCRPKQVTKTTTRVSRNTRAKNVNADTMHAGNNENLILTETKPKGRTVAKSKQPAVEDDKDVSAIAETFWNIDLDPELPDLQQPLRPMDNQLAKSLGDALNTSTAVLGYEWLCFMSSKHNRVPQGKLWGMLIALNTFGPIHNRHTVYPDRHKMFLCLSYLRHIFSRKGMLDACCANIDTTFQTNHNGVSYANTFFHQMTSNYYIAENDESRYTKAAAERVIQSLYAKACFAEIFNRLLRHNLHPFVVEDAERKRISDDDSYKMSPIVRDVVRARRGAKDAFEQSVRCFAHLYLKWGHFLIDDGLQPYLQREVTHDTLYLASEAMQRLMEEIGSILSYLAWLYSKEANENVKALAEVIGNVIHHAIEEDTFDRQPLLGKKYTPEKFVEKLKLRSITMIKKEVVPQLRPTLAERLSVASLYNILYGE